MLSFIEGFPGGIPGFVGCCIAVIIAIILIRKMIRSFLIAKAFTPPSPAPAKKQKPTGKDLGHDEQDMKKYRERWTPEALRWYYFQKDLAEIKKKIK